MGEGGGVNGGGGWCEWGRGGVNGGGWWCKWGRGRV